MEPPPFYHRRYVSPPSENPNLYNPHLPHHRLPPPPLPPIQPPPPQHHISHPRPPLPPSLPAPFPFSYRPHPYPIQDRPAPAPAPPAPGQYSSNYIPPHILKHPHHLSPPRDLSLQNCSRSLPFYEENSNFVGRWADLPPPPRVPAEPPFYHQQRRPLSPIPPPRIDNNINNYERNFRFRDEGFRDNGNRENPLWGGRKDREFDVPDYVDDDKYRYGSFQDEFERNSSAGFERDVHGINRDIGSADSQGADMVLSTPTDFALNVRSYDSYNDRNEDPRRGYSRLGNDNEYSDGDGVSTPSLGLRWDRVDSGYDEVDRVKGKMVGHVVQEFFNRSPRKTPVQKKSALLRIQVGKANNKNNYRNRSHDNSRYSRVYYDESNLSVSGSSRGKEQDFFVNHEREMDREREKSPVELDVSFKSNALVAKAIKAPSNSVAESDANVTTGNRKLKKIMSPRTKLNDDSIKAFGSSRPSSSSDKFHEKLKEKIVSFKIDSSTGALGCPSRSYRHEKDSEEKVIGGERHDFLSGSDKGLGQLAGKMSVSDHGAHSVDGSPGGKDSVKSLGSYQGVKCVAPDGVLLQRSRKRKSVGISLQNDALVQSVDVNCELGDPDNASIGSLSTTSQLEEGVTHLRDKISLAGLNATNDVISSSHANELLIEKVNIASDVKVDGMSSSLPVSFEHSALIAISSDLGNTALCGGPNHVAKVVNNDLCGGPNHVAKVVNNDLCGGPNHVAKVVNNDLSRLSSNGGLVESQNLSEVLVESKNTATIFRSHDVDDSSKHPCLNEPSLVETSLVREASISVDSNVGLSSPKENKVHECQIDTFSSDYDALDASNTDQGFCISPGNITVLDMASANAVPEEFQQNFVINVSNENDIVKGCLDANPSVSLVGTLVSPKLEKTLGREVAGSEDLSNDSPACCSTDFANSLENRTLSGLGLLDHSSKQSIVDGEETSPGNASIERSPTSMFFNSAMVGRKRKVTDGQLDVHVVKASKLAGSLDHSADDQDESLMLQAENFVCVENEIVPNGGENTLGKYCFEEGLSVFNIQVKGSETRKECSSILTFPVLSEVISAPKGAITPNPSAEPSSNIGKGRNQMADSVAHSCQDETTFTGLSSHSEALVIHLPENNISRDSYGGTTGCFSKLDHGASHRPDKEAEIKDKDKTSVVFSTSDLQFNNCLLSEGYQGKFGGPDENQKQSTGDTDCANYTHMENLAVSSDSPSWPTSSTDGQIDSPPDTLSNKGSPEDVVSNFGSAVFNNTSRMNQVSHSYQRKDNMSNNPVFTRDGKSFPVRLSLQSSQTGTESGVAVAPELALDIKAASSIIWNPSRLTQNINPSVKKSSLISDRLNSSVIKAIPGQMSANYSSAAKVARFSQISKPRTWHRTLNASPFALEPKSLEDYIHTRINSKKDVSKVQSSYVRRGNSLVRKLPQVGAIPQVLPSQSSLYHLNSGINNGRKGGGVDIAIVNPQSSATLGGSNSCSKRLKTAPLVGSIKSSSSTSSNPMDLTYLPLADPLRNDSPGEINNSFKSAEDMDTKRSSEEHLKSSEADQCETGSSNYLDCRSIGDEGNSGKKILYFKRKSNQLVAASNSSDVSLLSVQSSQALSSDSYFKRRKNQLIRTSLNGCVEQRAVIDDKRLSSQQQDSQKSSQIRSFIKRPSVAGFAKKKYSLVWTLNGTLSSRKDSSSGRWHTVRPNFFPWKRASSWTNYMHYLSSFSNDSLAICQKLRLSRKREAIYKRSLSGFSLRRSKVLGVGGRNLKWSKSMEKNSRKANKEATLAFAAAEKQKKAQNLASFALFKSRNYVSRERIFRIGSERYKMDPTRRTLQRISDEQNSFSDDESEKKKKKFYVPSRLLIGNDEYVRIGNGNQLVRDPKRRTRILANEKVRWSLHTARLRLARKKKYCQFFTRFGKCNKDDKKCLYIHDPSKIAVCTKYLNGSCSNPNCKLTHKVIPERMQDCSYFLQGLCSNENCPYRHVNVSPKSSVCEGFLRGYCADGNECLKKHTHVCPVFEATGSCPQVPECKLHHPKKRRKGMKRRASNLQKNVRGRYFGSVYVDVADCRTTVCETITGKCDDSISNEERLGDYISLDIRMEERELAFELRSEPVSDSEGPSDVEMGEVDELTKPVRIMNKTNIDSSPAVDSSSEMTAG